MDGALHDADDALPVVGPAKAGERLDFADLFRGLLMVHMALDHASLYWNRHRFADEFWDALPAAHDPWNFVARFSGVFVAPGFSFLAGFMIAVTTAARTARGIPEAAVTRRLLARAAVLIAAETLFFSLPFGRWQVGVLTCLGMCIAALALLRRLPPGALLAGSLAVLALHPLLRVLWTDRIDAAGIAVRVLHQAGKSGWLEVFYPFVPWIGVMGFGHVVGTAYLRQGARNWWKLAGLFVLLFVGVQMSGLGTAGRFERVASYEFLTWSKYPPDAAWLSASFAMIFAILAALQARPNLRFEPVAVFGRAAIFFYLVHFGLLQLTAPAAKGTLVHALVVWMAVLAVMAWPCRWWHDLRRRHPESVLKYL